MYTCGMSIHNCPWDRFDHAVISFCERELCGWITQPSNTWSNISYFIVGWLILRQTRHREMRPLRLVGWSCMVLGFGSWMYHQSSTFFFEVIDLAGMFLISGILMSLNLKRLFGWKASTINIIYITMTAASLLLMLQFRTIGIPIFATQITIALMLETLLFIRDQDTPRLPDYKYMFLTIAGFVLAFTIWGLDARRIICNPDNHWIQGHAIWHILNAYNIYFIYKFHRQFIAGRG